MAFRKISYLIPSCDGCGLAWPFSDPACPGGIPPHSADTAAALTQLPARYGWQARPRRRGRPLMVCRRCAAAGVIPDSAARAWLLALAGRVRRVVPFGPARRPTPAAPPPDHPESMTAVLSGPGGAAGRAQLRTLPGHVMGADTMRMPARAAQDGSGQRLARGRAPGGQAVTGAAADVRVQAARDRLAEIPSDDVLVTLDPRSLATVAGKAVIAAQLLDAHIRDADSAGHRDGCAPAALTLDEGQAATVLAALDDASALRREVTAWCPDCQASPAGPCEDHHASLETAGSYDRLRWQLEAQAPAARPAEREAGWEATS